MAEYRGGHRGVAGIGSFRRESCMNDWEVKACMEGLGRAAWWLSNLRAMLDAFPPDQMTDLDPTFGLMWTLEDAVFRALVVQVANLNDPSQCGGGANGSFRTLLERKDFEQVKQEFGARLRNALPALRKIEEFRNTAVAHSDPKGDWKDAPSLDEIESVLVLMDQMVKEYFAERRIRYRNSCFMPRSKQELFKEMSQAAARVCKE